MAVLCYVCRLCVSGVTPFKTVVGKIVSRKIFTITFISIYFPCVCVGCGCGVCCWKLNKHSRVVIQTTTTKNSHFRQLISSLFCVSYGKWDSKQQAYLCVLINNLFTCVCVCESHLSSKKYFFNLKTESKSIFIVCTSTSLETECIFRY